MIDWYARNGMDGLFAACQSSEIFCLSLGERAALANNRVHPKICANCNEAVQNANQLMESGQWSHPMSA